MCHAYCIVRWYDIQNYTWRTSLKRWPSLHSLLLNTKLTRLLPSALDTAVHSTATRPSRSTGTSKGTNMWHGGSSNVSLPKRGNHVSVSRAPYPTPQADWLTKGESGGLVACKREGHSGSSSLKSRSQSGEWRGGSLPSSSMLQSPPFLIWRITTVSSMEPVVRSR